MALATKTAFKTNFVPGPNGSNQATEGHANIHNNIGTVLNDLQDKIGIDSSTDTGSIDYKLSNASSSDPGHKHTLANGATDVTASADELNYSSGVTSAIQTQIDAKATNSFTASRAIVSSAGGTLAVATTTATELGHVSGVTSAIQTQIDAKLPLTQTFTAIETIEAGRIVYVEASDLLDNFETYADDAGVQAEWVDSDAGNKMVGISSDAYNDNNPENLIMTSVAGNNTGDYADNTITSKNLTGYSVHITALASAESGDWEFLLSSGANAVTSNKKQAMVFTDAGIPQHFVYPVADMTADNGTYNPAATTHVGFRCADDTGSPKLTVMKIWFTKEGTTYYGIKKSVGVPMDPRYGGAGLGCIGYTTAEITAGNSGSVVLLGQKMSGLSDLIPGYSYTISSITSGQITWDASNAVAYVPFYAVAISTTELLVY